MKKLKLTDILLLSVAGTLDLFQEIKDPGGLFSNYYENFYGFVPNRWKKHNYYTLVSRLIAEKKIKKNNKNHERKYQITPKGLSQLQKRQLLLTLQKGKWDGKWRILIFDIEEANRAVRNTLRYQIKELGFGYLQKSVWISPYDVIKKLEKYLQMYNLKEKVILIESSKLSIPNKELALIVWPINKIQSSYEEIYRRFCKISNLAINKKINKKQRAVFNKTYKELIYVILQDPHLPKEFLPKDWPYRKTVELAKKLRSTFFNYK
jgi:phenylacetic acid degradation operon negative regulatory protein